MNNLIQYWNMTNISLIVTNVTSVYIRILLASAANLPILQNF